MIIAMYAMHELGYDRHIKNGENKYRISIQKYEKGELKSSWARTPSAMGRHLQAEMPEIKSAVWFWKGFNNTGVTPLNTSWNK